MDDLYNSDDELELSSIVSPKKPLISEVIESLQNCSGEVLPASVYYGLSELVESDLLVVRSIWPSFSVDLRRKIISELSEASERDFSLDYTVLGNLALSDTSEAVREAAIEMLWADESIELLSRLVDIALGDESATVRAAAAGAIGRFILLGEFGEIPVSYATLAQDAVMNIWSDETEDIHVRRRSLEALSNSSQEVVSEAIQEAYDSSEYWFRVSAIYAMGHSADSKWADIVLKEMNSLEAEIRFEAARAAGELGLEEAAKKLGHLALDNDRETRLAAIWSLGEIGGREVLRILSALAQDAEEIGDADLLEATEDAIGNATLVGDFIDVDRND